MRYFFLLFLPLFLFGEDLKSLLEYAKKQNNLLVASTLITQAKQKELDSTKDNYYPKIDIAAFYTREDEPDAFTPGTVYGLNAKIKLNLYDGGKKAALTTQKTKQLQSAKKDTLAKKEELFLTIVENFYTLQTLQASLKAQKEALKSVDAQLLRVKKFYKANLATKDDINKLQAAYEHQKYSIESLRFKIFSLHKKLELLVGVEIKKLQESHFKKVDIKNSNTLHSLQTLMLEQQALQAQSKILGSYYHPNLQITESYSVFGYENKPSFGGKTLSLLDNQNKLMVTLSMRLFDFGAIKEQQESFTLKSKALLEKVKYQTKQQQMQQAIAKERIVSAKLNILSTQSALKAAKSAFQTTTKKYQSNIVDNIAYLDALTTYTQAQALYKKSLNDLEVAYALYYYYNGKNLEEYL